MFQLQGVVFIAVLCAVSAAVTVNIYEDENVRVKVHEVESCIDASCDRTCRLLGFTSGICVGDTCECMKQKKDVEQIQQNDISSLDEDITGNGLSGCDPNACYQLCRRLKFPSGTCINGRCKCDNFRRESELLEQNDIPSLDEGVSDIGLSGCDPNACYQLCRRLKFPSGTCVNGRCKCDNFRRGLVIELLEQNDIPSLDEGVSDIGLSGCDPNACYQLCRRLKFPSGTCINGRCKCDNFRREPDFEIFRDQGVKEIIGNSIDSNYVDTRKVVTMPIQDCDQLACMMGCQELGFPGGSCFLDKCRCNKRVKEESLRSLQSCNNVNCYFMCRRWGYIGGSCRAGVCLCV